MAQSKKAPAKRAPRKAASTPKDPAADARVAAQEHDKAAIDPEASADAVQELKELAADTPGFEASTPESVAPTPEVVRVPSTTVVETEAPKAVVEASDPPPPPTEFSTGEVVPSGVRSLDDLIRDAGFDPETTPPSRYEVVTRGGVAVEVRRAE